MVGLAPPTSWMLTVQRGVGERLALRRRLARVMVTYHGWGCHYSRCILQARSNIMISLSRGTAVRSIVVGLGTQKVIGV